LRSKENFNKKKNAPKDETWIETDQFAEMKEGGNYNITETEIISYIL